jgi:hypothetical protein
VCHAFLQDPVFFRLLLQIDTEFAAETRLERCPRCGGALHCGDYPRKPRGCPASVLEEYSSRFSFTCGRCEKRATPLSVRFFGRRVYVAVALMLTSPPSGTRAQELADELGIPVRTMACWRTWWNRDFLCTPFWQSRCERFQTPVPSERLPGSLMERFAADSDEKRMELLLRFVAPLSSRTVSG